MVSEGLEIVIGADVAGAQRGIQQVNNSMSKLQLQSKRSQLAVFAFSQVLREAPSFAFSVQTGILAMSNNFPILVDAFKAAIAAGLSFTQVIISMAKSLFTIGGIVTLGITALTLFSRQIFGLGKNTKRSKEDLTEFGEIVRDVSSELAKSASRVTFLYKALSSNELSLKQRKAALEELKKINTDFFGSLKEEDGLIKNLKSSYDNYISNLKEIGRVKAIESQLTKLFDKKLSLELSIDRDFLSATSPGQQRLISSLKRRLDELGGAVDLSKESFDAYNKTQQQRIALQQKINKLQQGENFLLLGENANAAGKEIRQINLQIEALSDLLNDVGNFGIKIAPGGDKEIKKFLIDVDKFIQKFPYVLTPDFKFDESSFSAFIKEMEDSFKREGSGDFLLPIFSESQKKEIDDLFKDFSDFGERGRAALSKISFGNITQGIISAKKELSNLQFQFKIFQEVAIGVGQAFGDAFESLLDKQNAIQGFLKSLGNALKRLVQQLIAAAAAAGILAAVFPTGGVGGISGFAKFFPQLLGFAHGGIVSNPTIGLIGEGAGTRASNPEIVAPLDKLKNLLNDSNKPSVPRTVNLHAHGRELRGVLDLYDKGAGVSF